MSSTIYTVKSTDGTKTILIEPGTQKGPPDDTRDNDLFLFGRGNTNWGQGYNINFYRLLETFACPQKETGDSYLGVSGNYDSSIHPILPKDEYDLGVGQGITKPVIGQNWFNTTTQQQLVYDGTQWTPVSNASFGTDVPSGTQDGGLWYDEADNQLKILVDGSWESVANRYLLLDGTSTMDGNLDLGNHFIQNVNDPVNPQDAATLNYVQTVKTNILTAGEVENINADNLATGTVPAARLSGTYNIVAENANNVVNEPGTLFAPLASPAFTGTPTAPTPPQTDSSDRVATTEFVQSKASAAVPPGTVITLAWEPTQQWMNDNQFLEPDGSVLDVVDYPELYAVLKNTYGGTPGSTFALPNLTDEFARLITSSSSRPVGDVQPQAIENHGHWTRASYTTQSSARSYTFGGFMVNPYGLADKSPDDNNGYPNNNRQVGYSNSGNETRPRNVALFALIKY